MARYASNRQASQGLPPGSMVFIGKKRMEKSRIRLIAYDENSLDEVEINTLDELNEYQDSSRMVWINIDGIHDTELIKNLGHQFNLTPLLLEDILNTEHRPKLEHFEQHLLIIVKMLFLLPQSNHLQAEQLSLLLGENLLITFQEKVGDVFESVRDRLRKKSGKIRSRGTDYLAYALLDTVVDNYSYIIDNLGGKIEQVEELMQNPDKELLEDIYEFKREILFYRKSIRPIKEMIIQFHQSDSGIVSKSTLPFIKDLQDLVGHVFESVEAYHDMLTDQISMYQTTVSNRMNEVMKVLTIFAAIFIPLTFLAGVYGMNFDNIPELHYKYSYYILWSIFIGVFLAMVFYFRRKKWL